LARVVLLPFVAHANEVALKNAYIKFRSREDAVAGFTELVAHYDVSCLTNDIFCVPPVSLERLDSRDVRYSLASEDEIATAQPLWDFSGSGTSR
jgi:hypothetical protein